MAQSLGDLIYNIKADSKGFNVEVAKADASMKSFSSGLQGLSIKNIAALGGIGAAVGAIGGVLIKATKEAAKFESTVSDFATLLDGNTAKANDLADGIERISRTVPKDANELGAGLYNVLSAGITNTSDALNVLEKSGQLAVAGLGDTKGAVDLMTSAINAFKIPASQADVVADNLFKTVKAGKTTVDELRQGFGAMAPSAAATGVSLQEVLSATAALTTTGEPAAQAYTQLRSLFNELTTSGNDVSKALEAVGISNVKTAIQSDGLNSVLLKLRDAAGNNDIAFKNLFSSQEAGAAALALATTVNDAYNNTLDTMLNGTNALGVAFSQQANTTQNQLVLAQNQLNETLRNLGEKILPIVNNVLSKFLTLMDRIRREVNIMTDFTNKTIALDDKLVALRKEQGKLADGTSQFTEAQIKAGLSAVTVQKETVRLQQAQQLLSTALEKGALSGQKSLDVLAELNPEYKKLADSGAIGFSKNVGKELEIVNARLGEFDKSVGTVNAALEPFNALGAETDAALTKMADSAGAPHAPLVQLNDDLKKAADQAAEAAKRIQEDLAKAFSGFNASLSTGFEDTNKGLADIIVKAEDAKAKLQDSLKTTEDGDQKKRIQDEIDAQNEILNARKGFEERQAKVVEEIRGKLEAAGIDAAQSGLDALTNVKSLEEQVQQQRALAQLNEFQLFEQQQNAKLLKLTDDFITEINLIKEKIAKQQDLEAGLTSFLDGQNKTRTGSVLAFTNVAISQYQRMVNQLQQAVSLQQMLRGGGGPTRGQAEGGFTPPEGARVHGGEFVAPASMVSSMPDLFRQLDSMRGNTINQTFNNNFPNGDVDLIGFSRRIAFQLKR